MTHFTIHSAKSAPEGAKPILEQLQARLGFIPNLAATMADNPLTLEAYVTLGAIFGRGSFNPVEQQIVLMVTSRGNQCTYCMAVHSTFAKALGAPETVLEAVRTGKSPSDPRLAALVTFSQQVMRQHGQISSQELQDFLDTGFTQAQALEVLIGVIQGTLASLVHQMAHTPLDAGFQPQQWAVSA